MIIYSLFDKVYDSVSNFLMFVCLNKLKILNNFSLSIKYPQLKFEFINTVLSDSVEYRPFGLHCCEL